MTFPWMDIARKEIGVKEIAGDRDNPRVIEYHQVGAPSLNAQADSVPWCAAFVGWVLDRYGSRGTGRAVARSYLKWGYSIPEPRVGCVVVLKRGDSTWQGHVGFVVEVGPIYIKVLGGNQSDEVNIQRFARYKVLGYRFHKDFLEIPAPKLVKA